MMNYLALGDSYTIGESVPETASFPAQTVQLLRDAGLQVADPRIIARTGWTTDELEAAIHYAGIQETFSVVSLLIGVNDQYRGRSVEEYKPAFTRLLRQAIAFTEGHAGRVVVLSIPDWGVTPFAAGRDREKIAAEIDAFNAANKAITESMQAVYLDITPDTRKAATDNSLVAEDGLHPSASGYAIWAQRLARLLHSILS